MLKFNQFNRVNFSGEKKVPLMFSGYIFFEDMPITFTLNLVLESEGL